MYSHLIFFLPHIFIFTNFTHNITFLLYFIFLILFSIFECSYLCIHMCWIFFLHDSHFLLYTFGHFFLAVFQGLVISPILDTTIFGSGSHKICLSGLVWRCKNNWDKVTTAILEGSLRVNSYPEDHLCLFLKNLLSPKVNGRGNLLTFCFLG